MDGCIDRLARNGYCVEDDFIDRQLLLELHGTVMGKIAQGSMRAAGVGRGASHQVQERVRGDQIVWLEESVATVAEQIFWQKLNVLKTTLNHQLFLGLDVFEGHYAYYPIGAFYKMHLDRFRDNNGRVLSMVLYLNPTWAIADGGQLQLYEGDHLLQSIAPVGGRLVLFLSERFPHEVLPAQRERFSLTGWFKRRDLARSPVN